MSKNLLVINLILPKLKQCSMLPSNLKYFSLILLITYTHILFAQPDCIGNQFDIFGVCGGDNTIQGAIDAADIGSTINIPSGIYDESLTISKSVYLIASSEVTLNVSSYTSGITITSNTENVTISGLTISGNNLTGAGIVVQPGAKNISIVDNIITDVLLPGGGNTSPLSYGILCWGNPASGENPPTNITIDNNSILNVLGSAISLGTYSVSVSITNNNFSNILPVEIGLPAPVSIGIQSEFSTNLEVIGNTYNSLDISNNLISCLGSTLLESNTYNDSELMLNTTHPHNISMNDVPWESIVYDSSPLVFESYYSSTDAASYQELFAATVFLNTLIATSSSTLGCNDVLACNFSSDANVDDGSCTYADQYYDCDGNCLNDSDTDGVCDELEVVGCQDPVSCNYDSSATDEGACTYADQYYDCDGNCLNDSDTDGICDELEIFGCTDDESCHYDETATEDDGSCGYTNTGIDTQIHCDTYTWIDGFVYTASNDSATFVLTNASGCDSVVTLDLMINISPPIPLIEQTISTTISTTEGYTGYYWYLNDNLYDTSSGSSLNVSTAGIYEVEVVDSLGCSTISDQFAFGVILDIDEFDTDEMIRIYPNPFKDDINVVSPNQIDQIDIYNTFGKLVYTQDVNNYLSILSLSDLESSIYIVLTRFQDGSISKERLIKVN